MTLICFPFLHSRGAVLAKSFLSLADIVLTFRVPFNCRFSVTCQTIESWRYFDLFKSLPFDALTVFSTMALFWPVNKSIKAQRVPGLLHTTVHLQIPTAPMQAHTSSHKGNVSLVNSLPITDTVWNPCDKELHHMNKLHKLYFFWFNVWLDING